MQIWGAEELTIVSIGTERKVLPEPEKATAFIPKHYPKILQTMPAHQPRISLKGVRVEYLHQGATGLLV